MMMRRNFAAGKEGEREKNTQKHGRNFTLVGRGLEQHLDEFPVDEAVVHREDMEARLGIRHRHGGVGGTSSARLPQRFPSLGSLAWLGSK